VQRWSQNFGPFFKVNLLIRKTVWSCPGLVLGLFRAMFAMKPYLVLRFPNYRGGPLHRGRHTSRLIHRPVISALMKKILRGNLHTLLSLCSGDFLRKVGGVRAVHKRLHVGMTHVSYVASVLKHIDRHS